MCRTSRFLKPHFSLVFGIDSHQLISRPFMGSEYISSKPIISLNRSSFRKVKLEKFDKYFA